MVNYFKLSKFFLYLVPFTVAIVSTSTIFPFIVGKYAFFRGAVGIAFIFFLLGLLFQDKSSVIVRKLLLALKSPLFIAVSVFTVIFVLACLFGINPQLSFWSNFERGEGGLQIIFLFLFFFLLSALFTTKEQWRKFLWCSVVAALLMILYGVAAGLGIPKFIGSAFGSSGFRFAGSIGNPAYVATYLLFSLFFVFFLWISGPKRNKILLWFFTFIFVLFFILAATRGAFVGLMAGAFVGIIYIFFKSRKFRKPAILAFLFLAVVFSSGFYFRNHPAMEKVPGSRIFQIGITEKTFQHRAIMWGIAVQGWKERPLLGWGPENYSQIFYRYYNPAYHIPGEPYGAWFDRAHSVYFDYLSQTGILGLLAYLSMFGAVFWLILKKSSITRDKKIGIAKEDNILKALFLASVVAYMVQGLALFEVLVIYLQLFTFLALTNYHFKRNITLSAKPKI